MCVVYGLTSHTLRICILLLFCMFHTETFSFSFIINFIWIIYKCINASMVHNSFAAMHEIVLETTILTPYGEGGEGHCSARALFQWRILSIFFSLITGVLFRFLLLRRFSIVQIKRSFQMQVNALHLHLHNLPRAHHSISLWLSVRSLEWVPYLALLEIF